MKEKDIDISIIIVNYKTPELTRACVQSIVENKEGVDVEIIIVDNKSEDESEKLIKSLFPEVKWINAGYNSGFARANNLGIRAALGKYILILNSDTVINKKTLIITLADYKKLEKTKEKIGFMACQVIGLDGNIQHNSRMVVRNIEKIVVSHPLSILVARTFRIQPEDKVKLHQDMDDLHKTFHSTLWLGGTFLFYNRKISSEQGQYFDEDFFMYGEDTEWSLRLTKLGFKHFFTPNTSITHVDGGSFKIKMFKWVQITVSEWLFLMKYYGKFKYFFIALFNLTGLQLDRFLIRRAIKRKGDLVSNEVIEDLDMRREVIILLKKNFFKILFRYKRKTSFSKQYLKVL